MQAGAAKALHTRDIKSGLDVSDEAVTGAWASVRDDANPVTWATFTYVLCASQIPRTSHLSLIDLFDDQGLGGCTEVDV